MGLLKIIFVISLLLFPFGEITRFEFGNGVAITLNDIGVGLMVIAWLILTTLNKKYKNSFLIKPILIFAGICFISLLINLRLLNLSEFLISFLYLIRWIFYAGIFFIVDAFDEKFKRKVPFFMVLSGTIIVFTGFIQYFMYPALRNLIYLGWDEHLYRMFSTFLDPNFLGAFLVLNFLFVLGLFLHYFKDIRKFGILGVLGILNLIAVFLTYSRSALVMLFVSILTFLILGKKMKTTFVIVFIFIILVVLLSKTGRSEGTNLLRSVSSEARIGSSIAALNIIKDNPILGVGFNTYRYTQYRYGIFKGDGWQNSHAAAGTDNSFLFVLATTGIIGLLSYIYLWYKILKKQILFINTSNNKFTKIFSAVIISSIIGIFINTLFINSLFYPFIMEWLWILIALNSSNLKVKENI